MSEKDEFDWKTIELIRISERRCSYETKRDLFHQSLKDFKAQIIKENPLAGLSDDELKMIMSFTPKKTKQPQINKILHSGREKLNEILTRRKQLSKRENEVKQ